LASHGDARQPLLSRFGLHRRITLNQEIAGHARQDGVEADAEAAQRTRRDP
jgi:hypothetical protein